jgi:predicted nuclease of predicted toxin-antitoxin system
MKFLIDAQLPRRFVHQIPAAALETTQNLDLRHGNRTTDRGFISCWSDRR